jgi:hypothetical protein
MSAKVVLSGNLARLLRSELERTICEAALSEDDSLIARRYFVEKVPQIDIAAELDWERASVTRRVKRISPILETVADKLYTEMTPK